MVCERSLGFETVVTIRIAGLARCRERFTDVSMETENQHRHSGLGSLIASEF